ncbi:right-handed parallel beta-helix repeat-containing protein [Alteromonas aestuariivivens]|uniref:Right-handed parallel beta-helix repeat-containing protein n=1 Tax=Alteromonas aestuariivivens TaxID=1938339 RepID=A0A3D8M998_9ALTE|nr:right-handed parallel beta-helix repeat-containing protein [Alteromonas aestuariivivens]RDV26186.1 right-handed parallel beta-helix repeat-containing protein [Alteromonas aestuariivivens]
MIKNIKKKICLSTLGFLAIPVVNAANCTSTPVNPNGNVSQLKDALQQATNTGLPLTITGTYYISSDIKVTLRKDLVVDATGANFIATSSLDGDMFSFDTVNGDNVCNNENALADFHWDGGSFNMANAYVSKVVPYTQLTPSGREGTQNTGDALSIRGVVNSTNYHKLDELIIENITYTGTASSSDPFYLAGGDSAILMTGALKATIRYNNFYGVRDAAVYLSAGGDSGQFGDHFTIHNNYVERAFDGFTSKRGADNIVMRDNDLVDVAVGLSVKSVNQGWQATNITIKRNTIDKAMRAISLETANNVTVDDNTIDNLGDVVANQSSTVANFNSFSDAFEGISLIGVQGTNVVSNNSINGITGSSREGATTTWGIVTRSYEGRSTTGVTKTTNSFYKLDKWSMDL